ARRERLDTRGGGGGAGVAEEAEPRGSQRRRLADEWREGEVARGGDPAAVEADGGAERTACRDEEGDPAAEAEADGADALAGEPGVVEHLEGGVDVGEEPVVGDAFEQGEDLVEVDVVVVVDRATPGPVEERGGDRVVSDGGETSGHVLDVLVHAERFLDDHPGAARVAVGGHLVDVHRAVGRRDGYVLVGHGYASARWSNATLIAPDWSWVARATNASGQASSPNVWVSMPVRSTRPSATRSR